MLKAELVDEAAWATRTAARTEIFDYIEAFHNGQRRHSALGYLTPRVFEQERAEAASATVLVEPSRSMRVMRACEKYSDIRLG